MSQWIIDDLGKISTPGTDPGCGILSASLGVNANGTGVIEYAIQNLGFIAVKAHGQRLHVRCRPAVVSERAIGALSYLLLDNPKLPVAISWFDEIWQIEHTPDARSALSFVSYVLELKSLQSTALAPRIRSRPSQQAEQKWQDARSAVFGLWRDVGRSGAFTALLDRIFHGRWSLFAVEPGSGSVQTLDRGDGYPPLHPFFAGRQPVRSLESLADGEYRSWIHQGFVDVAAGGRPRFDDVDAVVFWPRFGDIRTRYWRAVVPLATRGATCTVLSASGNNSGIDLRPQNVEEPGGVLSDVIGSHP